MVEPRVYYDDNGKILCYTCEELDGNYITIDNKTYAIADPNLIVVAGELVKKEPCFTHVKLKPSTTGVRCSKESVCIVVPDNYLGETITWEVKEYESKYY